ncbi:MAG TPA: hypothetical protein VM534_09415, partial [Thermoanaerobaculia bacterium]|nr:hypothetical protein [Thermoanaerobaculia bacterium]
MSHEGETRNGGDTLLMGAHLREEDIAGIEGIVAFPAGGILLTAVPLEPPLQPADREVIERAARIRRALIEREIFVAIRYGVRARTMNQAEEKCRPYLDRWKSLLIAHRG